MSVLHLNKNSFEEQVLQADGLVLVDFWAAWCGPCKMLSPIIESLADELDGEVTVAKVDIDEEGDLAIQYQVLSIPTLILFRDGKEVNRSVGFISREKILELIQNS